MGIVRGHAREFRQQFDEAMRESELADLKKDVENIARETEASLQATGQTVESSLNEARQSIDTSIDTATKPPPDPFAHDADGIPIAPPPPAIETSNLNGSYAGETPAADTSGETATQTAEEPRRPAEKSGA
jgi:sec-independent protein translocase protein TatB